MILLLVDDHSGREELARLHNDMGDPTTASLNTSTFDGARLDLSEVKSTCESMPFLSNRRLVIIRGAVGRNAETTQSDTPRKSNRESGEALGKYLESVPEFTDLVLLENGFYILEHSILKFFVL